MNAIFTTVHLAYGTFHFYDGYVIALMNEGTTVTLDIHRANEKILFDHFKDTPFVFIAHRIHSYSIDVLVYREVSKIDTLLGEAVVTPSENNLNTIDLEKSFMDKPFEHFDTLEKAVIWAKTLLHK